MQHTFPHVDTPFDLPPAFLWVARKRLIGPDGNSPVEPWHLLSPNGCRCLAELWPAGPGQLPLVTFAKRQDNDDYACFEIESAEVRSIVVIHGWTASGYDIIQRCDSIWDWLKYVVDDIAEWQDVMENP